MSENLPLKIGVKTEFDNRLADIKRDLILFDKIIFVNGEFNGTQEIRESYELLEKRNLIELREITAAADFFSESSEHNEQFRELNKEFAEVVRKQFVTFFKQAISQNKINDHVSVEHIASHYGCRAEALALTERDTSNMYVPIVAPLSQHLTSTENKKSNIYSFLLNQLSVPDGSTPWEQIFEMKEDKDLRRKYYALVNWINTVTSSPKSISEIQDEYMYLYTEYEHQIQLHKAKYRFSTIEIVVNGIAEMFGNLVTASLSCFSPNPIPFSKVTQPLFDIRKAKIELLENESKITGREIAYIHDVNNIGSR